MKTLHLNGSLIHSIPTFYDQINLMLEREKTWNIGPSLDALNDALYEVPEDQGDSDKPTADASATVHWHDHEHSREALGFAATERWFLEKLESQGRFNMGSIQKQLDDLRAGTGPTYFEIILEIFADHPSINLILD